ncbi:unnamed protein product [Pipistrellus nathusii]|uniref:Uncharacterized protein n=1 Tax=Pipistrellus nathusii TaxID=59473 RepID=A0ABP0A2M5_PIPNA
MPESTHPLPKKVRGPPVPWDLRLSHLPLQSPAWPEQAAWPALLLGVPPKALGGSARPPPRPLRDPRETPLESGHRKPWGEAETPPEGTPAPLTVTPHTQQ